ncbi:MAG: DinB family protein [Hyphomonadaceae bacterium]
MSSQLDTLRWQFDLAWRLAGYHLPALTDDMCVWAPSVDAWNVRRGADGVWRHDWADAEPEPAPPVSIGWLTWHLIWWWSGMSVAVRGETPPSRESVVWPGDAEGVRRRLGVLASEWAVLLEGLREGELDRTIAHPWPQPRPLAIGLAWVNLELMKNVAEIGVVRHLYEAARR